MSGFRLKEEVRKVQERAAETADSLKTLAATTAADVGDQIAEQSADVKEIGLTKLGELLDDLNIALPVLREAGFAAKGVDLQMGVPPRCVARFACGVDVPDEDVETLMQKNRERKLTILLLRALLQTQKLTKRYQIAGMKASELDVEVGLLPVVTVKFG
jgi:hypothetical protein